MSKIWRRKPDLNGVDAGELHKPAMLKKSPSDASLGVPSGKKLVEEGENTARKEAKGKMKLDGWPRRGAAASYGSSTALKEAALGGSSSGRKVSDKAPTLDVDIRNSLMLPDLSQRFSVLLPKLSTTPEASVREMLATQRARGIGPSLTIDEEEMLLAEMRDESAIRRAGGDFWDSPRRTGQSTSPYSGNGFASPSGSRTSASGRIISPSASSPSLLGSGGPSPVKSPGTSPPEIQGPPTSTSFSSFRMIGAIPESPTSPATASAGAGVRSYGFSGLSGLRDEEYMRRAKRSVEQQEPSEEGVSQNTRTSSSAREGPTSILRISPNRANAYHDRTLSQSAIDVSQHFPSTTANQTIRSASSSTAPLNLSKARSNSPSARSALNLPFPPQLPPPTSAPPPAPLTSNPRSRTSTTPSFSADQAKRISTALQEIEAELRRMHRTFSTDNLLDEAARGGGEDGDGQEVIVIGSSPKSETSRHRPRARTTSNHSHSRGSSLSEVSETFPFRLSPTPRTSDTPSYTSSAAPVEASSPSSKLRASPRSHNLLAHVEPQSQSYIDRRPPPPAPIFRPAPGTGHQPRVSIDSTGTPRPVLTPSRTTPARTRHVPTPSDGSGSSFSSAAYVPGQPRPVGSMHRSEGSVSSRSRTPAGFNPVYMPPPDQAAAEAEPGRDSPSGPKPMIHARSSSLSKQAFPPSTEPIMQGSPVLGSPITSSATSLTSVSASGPTDSSPARHTRSTLSPASSAQPATIHEESDEGEGAETDGQGNHADLTPLSVRSDELQIQSVRERHSVADSRTESLASSPRRQADLLDPMNLEQFVGGMGESRRASVQNTASGASDGGEHPATPRRMSFASSVSSYEEPISPSDKIKWTEGYTVSPTRTGRLQGEGPDSLVVEEHDDGDLLRKLSGVSKAEMAGMQHKLVEKARAEREALRGVEGSPIISLSPQMPSSATAARPSSVSQRAMSPTLWREHPPPSTPPVQVIAPTPTETNNPFLAVQTQTTTPVLSAPPSLAGLCTPPQASDPPPVPTPPSAQSTYQATLPSMAPTSATSSDDRDESLFTPVTEMEDLSRTASINKTTRPKPEDDPAVRRAFEAKIADAYAQLNRTPMSNQGKSLERKFTKRNAPMQISSPRLLSSTAVLPPSPETPGSVGSPNAVSGDMRKALDKASGSGSKMSQRWKKLMGKKGTSLSAEEVGRSMISPSTVTLTPTTTGSASGAGGGGSGRKLGEPFELPSQVNSKDPLARSQADESKVSLNAFKFPLKAPLQSVTSSGTVPTLPVQAEQRLVIANITPAPSPMPPSATLEEKTAESNRARAPILMGDEAISNFIAAGRALGLSESQLQDMLRQKQASDIGQNGTTDSFKGDEDASLTASNAEGDRMPPVLADAKIARVPSGDDGGKEKSGGVKGLLRSLSRRKQSATSTAPSADLSDAMPPSAKVNANLDARRIVRRTLLLPRDAVPPLPVTPVVQEASPDPASVGPNRRPSTKRKPINLTPEDESLVASSPILETSRLRKVSAGTSSVSSDKQQSLSTPHKGLGFLQPIPASQDRGASPSKESTGSTGGSLYDLYGDDRDEAEVLVSPTKASKAAVRASQAVEIREYADGEIVFAVVDALHDTDDPNSTPNLTHSRKSSYASSHQYSNGDSQDPFLSSPTTSASPAVGFQLRHRDRNQPQDIRPVTKVYKTSAQDIDALFDELAKDFETTKGRIDFRTSLASRYDDDSFTGSVVGHSPALQHGAVINGSLASSPRSPFTPAMSNEAFEDAPSPLPVSQFTRPNLPAPIHAVPASHYIPAGGFSPKRHMMVQQGFAAHRQDLGRSAATTTVDGIESETLRGVENAGGAPATARTVQDRMQALLDRLKVQDPA